jgi:mannose-6-phosphate isomerase-like protein (cupin superfamily)
MQPKVVHGENTTAFNVLGVEHIIRVSGADTNEALVFAELRMPAGAGIPRHVHTREDEVFHVVAGQVAFTLADRELTAGPETTVFGPRGVPHAFRNAGAVVARMLLTIAPAGLELMFAELSRLPPGVPDLARVGEIVGRHGISFA